jgi:PPP family 3-phenylpropionic acid transporter
MPAPRYRQGEPAGSPQLSLRARAGRLPTVDRQLVYPKAFYLVYFLAMAFYAPFLPLYYRQIGMTGQQIGVLGAVTPIITLFSGPLWGGLADATRRHRALLLLTLSSALVFVPAVYLTTEVLVLSVLVVVGAFLRSPTMALVDSTVLRVLGKRRALYGQQRLWGTVGYAFGALCVGTLTQRAGLHAGMYVFLPLMVVTVLISLRLPVTEYRRGMPFWRGLRTLVTNRQWSIFLAAAFMVGLGRSASGRFLMIHLSDLGLPRTLLGLATAVGCVGEVPVFFYGDYVLRRWSTRTLLVFGWVVSMLRLFALSVMRAHWLILPLQLVQGIAFGATMSAGVSLTGEIAPEGMGATAQALYGAMRGGLAGAFGAFLGGMAYDYWGAPALFRCGGLAIAGALLFFALSNRRAGS